MFRLLDLWRELLILLPIIRDYAVALSVIAAAIGVALLAPGLRIKLAAALVAASVTATTVAYSVGIRRGTNRVKADWDWTLEMERREGEKARTEAEHAVRVEPADSGLLANDPWNRDTQSSAGGGAQGG